MLYSVDVEVYGKRYRMRSDHPERTKKVASLLDKRMDEISQQYDIVDLNKILLLSAMRLTEELLLTSEQNRDLIQEIQELNQLISTSIRNFDL